MNIGRKCDNDVDLDVGCDCDDDDDDNVDSYVDIVHRVRLSNCSLHYHHFGY